MENILDLLHQTRQTLLGFEAGTKPQSCRVTVVTEQGNYLSMQTREGQRKLPFELRPCEAKVLVRYLAGEIHQPNPEERNTLDALTNALFEYLS